MNLLVIQEQHFTHLANGQVWVNESSDILFWDRYLDVFDHLIVCARMECRNNNDTTNLIRSDRPEVEFLGLPNFAGVNGLVRNFLSLKKIIIRAIAKADCVIFRAPSPISLVAYPLVLKSHKPFALELMNNPMTTYSSTSMKGILIPFIRYFVTRQTREMCLKANGVSYVTEFVLQKMYPCKALVHTIESDDFFTSNYSTIRLDKENYSYADIISSHLPNPLVIVNSGKMNDLRKGQTVIIRCVKLLVDKGLNVQLRLIGDGKLRFQFEQLVKELHLEKNVIFEGWKAGYTEVQKVLKLGHIFMFPTLGEGLPRSVIEAMSNSLVPVVSDIDGVCELVPEPLLVRNFNENDFCKKIEYLIDHWDLINDFRKEVYSISQKYEYTILRSRRKAFYQKLYCLAASKSVVKR